MSRVSSCRCPPLPRKCLTLLRWLLLSSVAIWTGFFVFRTTNNVEVSPVMPVVVKTKPRVLRPALTWTATGSDFLVDNRRVLLLSGELHYFRVVPEYWEDRLRRMKAAGLNMVSTYVAWNLHEPIPGKFDFSTGRRNIGKFLELAKEVGLYVLVRPGPYICAEWEFGGLPSWLLGDPNMRIRSAYPPFLDAVERYFRAVYAVVGPYQHGEGGPVIGVQLENEYGTVGNEREYLERLYNVTIASGIYERLIKCDDHFAINKPDLVQLNNTLQTINADSRIDWHIEALKRAQPRAPVFVTEMWTGWFTLVGGSFSSKPYSRILQPAREILQRGASLNFYMIHGGTNFGFMNGAVNSGGFKVMATSYDYDSPISENGTLTRKYFAIRDLIKEFNPDFILDKPPGPIPVKAYGRVALTEFLDLSGVLKAVSKVVRNKSVLAMESLPINDGGGQMQGCLLYRHTSLVLRGPYQYLSVTGVSDFATLMINGDFLTAVSQGYGDGSTMERIYDRQLSREENVLDILVENSGRINYLPNQERKGLLGSVQFGGRTITNWLMYPLEFDKAMLDNLVKLKWENEEMKRHRRGPLLLRGELKINGKPADTFLRCDGFGKGIVIVNGEVLGRYWNIGPQRALYLPAPMLRSGKNTFMVFEMMLVPGTPHIQLVDEEDLGR